MTGLSPASRLDPMAPMARHLSWLLVWLALPAAGSIAISRAQTGTSDIVLRPGGAATVFGAWTVVSDPAAAGGSAVRHPNSGAAKLTRPLAHPVHYFELTFIAEAGVLVNAVVISRPHPDVYREVV